MLPVKFDFTVNEDRRGTNFEGVEAGHADPEGAFNLHRAHRPGSSGPERLAGQGRDQLR